MTKFIVHFRGDWERDELNTRSELCGGWVREYDQIASVPDETDRRQFEWMLKVGECVTQIGAYTYQIRRTK